jgi:tRNA-2-methylthio-N6-dimethylallyladenosine synthase
VTTDIIAGFSGESPEDHAATLRALHLLRYDGAYIYKYSVRPGTPAAHLEDDVPLGIKEARNQELLQLQKRISEENNLRALGSCVEVFADGPGSKDEAQLTGRSLQEKKVVFEGPRSLIGNFVKVRIDSLAHDTFLGTLV